MGGDQNEGFRACRIGGRVEEFFVGSRREENRFVGTDRIIGQQLARVARRVDEIQIQITVACGLQAEIDRLANVERLSFGADRDRKRDLGVAKV